MKSRLSLYLLSAILFSFVACSKEMSKEKGNGTGPGVNGDFYATINGNQWNADSLQLILVSNSGVSINGLSKTGEQISMVLPSFKTGTYTLNGLSASFALYVNLLYNVSNVFVSNIGTAGGTVTISSIDTVNHLVSGSFQFNLTNPSDNTTKTITKGVFAYVPYTGDTGGVVIPPPPGTGSDTVQATIDGITFDAAQVEVSITNGQLLIAGISSSGLQDLALIMPANITPGTYSMDFATGNYVGIYFPSPSVTLVSQTNGSLTILSNDTVTKRIKGTFSFNAIPFTSGTPAVITLGYFSINY